MISIISLVKTLHIHTLKMFPFPQSPLPQVHDQIYYAIFNCLLRLLVSILVHFTKLQCLSTIFLCPSSLVQALWIMPSLHHQNLQSISPLALHFTHLHTLFFCGGCKLWRERLKRSSNVMVKWSICKKWPHGFQRAQREVQQQLLFSCLPLIAALCSRVLTWSSVGCPLFFGGVEFEWARHIVQSVWVLYFHSTHKYLDQFQLNSATKSWQSFPCNATCCNLLHPEDPACSWKHWNWSCRNLQFSLPPPRNAFTFGRDIWETKNSMFWSKP